MHMFIVYRYRVRGFAGGRVIIHMYIVFKYIATLYVDIHMFIVYRCIVRGCAGGRVINGRSL